MLSHIITIEDIKAELKVANDRINEKDIQIANFERDTADLRRELDEYRRKELNQARRCQEIDSLMKIGIDSKPRS